jgi:copper chaperone
MALEISLKITGMTCGHCKMAVEKALLTVKGVKTVSVSLEDKAALVNGNNINNEELISAVKDVGYGCELISS